MSIWPDQIDHLPASAAEDSNGALEPGILLVDDNSFMLGIQAHLLNSMGYRRVGTAASAQSALDLMSADPGAVDVLICDLNMPGMDGIEFLQILNANAFRGSVILLSGEGARVMHTVQKLLGRGRLTILGALEKPANRDALRGLLDCWTCARAPVEAERDEILFSKAELDAASQKSQWVLHYQPKVDLQTGFLAGMEALVRWNHPVHGLIMPDRFIDMAEGCGAIDDLTDWVLREALSQLARWKTVGLRTRIAVNISMVNLRSPGFANRVLAIANEMSAAPQDLLLEVTESRLISPSATPLENLVRLRLQRFGLAIDDFGTGHSSLAQLRDIPFTELKVDGGFVHGARFNQITRPILEGSIGLAKRLGMQSVAEGVETAEDWILLREVGCDLAQGYFIARPMPQERVPDWIADWSARIAGLPG